MFASCFLTCVFARSLLYPTFASPWAESPLPRKPEEVFPACYYVRPLSPRASHLGKVQLETLFYIFYNMPKDTMQVSAAKELYVLKLFRIICLNATPDFSLYRELHCSIIWGVSLSSLFKYLWEAFIVSCRFASRIHEITDLKRALVFSLKAKYTRSRTYGTRKER